MPNSQWYRVSEACAVLGVNVSTVNLLREKGFLDFTKRGNRSMYSKQQIDELGAALALYPAMGQVDFMLFELYALQKEFRRCDDEPCEKRKLAVRRGITAKVNELVAQGRICTLKQLGSVLEVSPDLLHGWIGANKISAVRVGRSYYLTRRYADYLAMIFVEWLSVAEAAEQLGLSTDAITQWIRLGKLPALRLLNGRYSINPEDLKGHGDGFGAQDTVSIADAARIIGCTKSTLGRMIRQGLVAHVDVGNRKFIPRQEVLRWRQKLSTLNEPFLWLQPVILPKGTAVERPATLTRKQLGVRLGIGMATVWRWSEDGLLPYFLGTHVEEGKVTRLYIARYVFGFSRYLNGRKASRRLAKTYATVCRDKGNIV